MDFEREFGRKIDIELQKSLNPNIFADKTSQFLESSRIQADQNMAMDSSALGHQLNHLESRFVESRKEIAALQEHLANVVEQFNQFIRGNQNKLEKINQAVSTLESKENNHQTEMAQKMAALQMRLQERRLLDSKVQELVDRHQGVLRTYDVRLSQMNKLLAEKETQLLQSQAALNEAKMEISRLKRI